MTPWAERMWQRSFVERYPGTTFVVHAPQVALEPGQPKVGSPVVAPSRAICWQVSWICLMLLKAPVGPALVSPYPTEGMDSDHKTKMIPIITRTSTRGSRVLPGMQRCKMRVLLRLFFFRLFLGRNWRWLSLDLRLHGGGRALLQSRGIHSFRAGLARLGSVGLLDLHARLRWLFLHLLALRLGLRSFLRLLRLLLDHGSRLRRLDCRRHPDDGTLGDFAGWLGTDRIDCRRWHG